MPLFGRAGDLAQLELAVARVFAYRLSARALTKRDPHGGCHMFRTGHRADQIQPPEPTPAPAAPSDLSEVLPVTPAPATPSSATVGDRSDAVLGRGVTFNGTLRFSGRVRIDGVFSGKILSGDALTVGEGATVNADISCDSIAVHGTVSGSLTATRSVELHAPAQVHATVAAPSLVIDRGVSFDGTVRMRSSEQQGRSPRAALPVAVRDY